MSNYDKVKSLALCGRRLGDICVFNLRVYLIKDVMIDDLFFFKSRGTDLLNLSVHLLILLFLFYLCLGHLLQFLDLCLLLLNLGLGVFFVLLLQLVY